MIPVDTKEELYLVSGIESGTDVVFSACMKGTSQLPIPTITKN